MNLATQFPLHPKRRRVMPRNWAAEPEDRMINNLAYRRTRYGQGLPPPGAEMATQMRQQADYRRTTREH